MEELQLSENSKFNFSSIKKYLPLIVFSLSLLSLLLIWLETPFYFILTASQYLIFHNLAEFFSVAVSMSIFGVGWYSYSQTKNKYVLFLSVSFFTIGMMDFMHTLSYLGMPDFFTVNDLNKSSQLWLIARFTSAITLLISAFVKPDSTQKWINRTFLFFGSLFLLFADFFFVVLNSDKIPPTFIEGSGLTPLKINGEYVVIFLFVITLFFYWKKYNDSKEKMYIYFICGLIFSIFSEWSFTLYLNAYDTFNTLGHVYKILAFLFIYLDLFKSPIETPYLQLKEKQAEYDTLTEQLNLFFENSRDILCLGDSEGHIIKINKVWTDIFGYTIDDFKDKKLFDFVHPEDLLKTNESFEELQTSHHMTTLVNRFYCKDSTYKTIEWAAVAKEGIVFCVARDVNDMKAVVKDIKVRNEQDKLLNLMIGRELKMVELKRQIDELKKVHP